MCTCVCVCGYTCRVCVCVVVCACGCVHVCVLCLCTCVCACTCVCVLCLCTCVCVCAGTHAECVCMCSCVCMWLCARVCVCEVEIINGRYQGPASLRGLGSRAAGLSGAMGSVHLWPRLRVLGSSSTEHRNRAPGSLETAPRPRSRSEGHMTHLSLGSSKP